ncbi:MAG: hypothetical protein SVS15_08290, partial [Thermodesulfobacteriota bacterium]|nr:hypothetical protein [Thermodesulfobacteriota bacterium]
MALSAIPLFAAYIAYPLAVYAERLLDIPVARNWIDALWLVLLFLALLLGLQRQKLALRKSLGLIFAMCMAVIALVAVFKFGAPLMHSKITAVPYLMELKPLYYLAVSMAWFFAFGPPKPRDFVRFGLWLAAFLILEFCLGRLVSDLPLRPYGSGEVNYDACLLLISLCMATTAEQSSRKTKIWIFLGIAATLSRTATAAAAVVLLLSPNTRAWKKILMVSACAGAFALSFTLREIPAQGLESLERYWMWLAGIDLVAKNPVQGLFGFTAGLPLPARTPDALFGLWLAQQRTWEISGIFPFHFHSFWLRAVLTWGLMSVVGAVL